MASLLENGIDQIIDELSQTDYRVIIRPHPEFLKRRKQRAQQLQKNLESFQNFIWEDKLLNEDSLYEADLLITDRSGIAFEYAFGTERPVLFVDTPFKIHNPNWEKLNMEPIELHLRDQIGIHLSLDQLNTITTVVDELLNNTTNWPNKLQNLRQQHVFNWDYSVTSGCNYIKSCIKA